MKRVYDLKFIGVDRRVPDLPSLRIEVEGDEILIRDRLGTMITNKEELTAALQLLQAPRKVRTIVKSLENYNESDILDLLPEVLADQSNN